MSIFKRGVFDIESNGYLYETTVIWCIVIKDIDSGDIYTFGPDEIEDGVNFLSRFDMLIGHNICNFDVNLIWRFYPNWTYRNLRDTLCMSKLFHPERRGGHGLESFGMQFKRYKPYIEDFTKFDEGMIHRCTEDVEINHMAYEYLVNKYAKGWKWMDSLLLEQDFAIDQGRQELEGVDIDQCLAYQVVEKIDAEVEELDPILLSRMPKRVVQKGATVNKVFLKSGGYTKAVTDWFSDDEA